MYDKKHANKHRVKEDKTYIYIYMASWEPVDIDPTDRDEIGEEGDKWDDDLLNELERRFEELRRFKATLETSSDKDLENDILDKLRLKKELKKHTIELVANQIYDKMTKLFNDMKERFETEDKIAVEPQYKCFNLDDNGNLTFVHKNEVIGLGNIYEGLISLSKIRGLGVQRMKIMGFRNIR